MAPFEWIALACGAIAAAGAAAIFTGRWRPTNRIILFALFLAAGIAIGAAIGRLAATSLVAAVGVIAAYFVLRWVLRRRPHA